MMAWRRDTFGWSITIELPAEVVPATTTPEEFGRELRLAAAIHWHSRGEISQGKGAPIAGPNWPGSQPCRAGWAVCLPLI